MDYINQTVITLNDLNSVDEHINEIQSSIAKIQDQVHTKLNKTTNAFEDGQTTKVVGDILATISKINGDSNSDDPQKSIDTLIQINEEHKGLQVVNELTGLYETKKQAQLDQIYLDESCSIETDIENLKQKVEDYELAYEKIIMLNDESITSTLVAEVKPYLLLQFDNKVEELRQKFQSDLKSYLTKLSWLSTNFSIESLSVDNLKYINNSLSQLIEIQAINKKPIYPEPWWAIETLLDPFFVRFDYHFNGKKDTNKISKPEWAFDFVEEFLTNNLKSFELVINQSFKKYNTIMIFQVITSILVPIRTKILSMINVLNQRIEQDTNNDNSGRLLSHLIFELTSFDQRLRTTYKYNPYLKSIDEVPSKKWLGLTADILLQGDKERSGTSNWLNFESKLANNRFDTEIINDSNAMKIDMDYKTNESNGLKPTYSSLNLVRLFDNLTTHYQSMRMVKFQLKYVSTIQLKLLDRYLEYLTNSLGKFDELYTLSSVLNLIPGSMDTSSNQESNDSLKGIIMLTEIYCSAQFIINNLEQWSEELIFIQLWNAFKAISNKPYDKESTIFESAIHQYTNLLNDITTKYNTFFKKGIRNYLKEYINSSQWDIEEIKDSSSQFAPLVTNLPLYLNHLHNSISSTSYYTIVNEIVSSICSLWYEYIITNNNFTKIGSKQLYQDFYFVTDQLQEELLLSANYGLVSTHYNHHYLKVVQSIEVLNKFDSILAKNLLDKFNNIDIREEFPDGLDHLSNDEIKQVLYRIL